MAWGQAFSQPAACQVVDLGVQGQRVQAGGMGAGTTSFSPYPQLSSSDCPRMLQTEEDDLEFWILWSSLHRLRGLRKGLQAEGLRGGLCHHNTGLYSAGDGI